MKIFKRFSLCFAVISLSISVKSQTLPEVEIYNSSTCPLANNSISDIKIDHLGNRWFGTFGGGLAKYDGTSWTIYTTSNSGIPSNQVSCIDEDAAGNIWIGTRTAQFGSNMGEGWGIAKFNGATWTVYNKNNSGILDDVVNCIKADQSGNVWVGIGYNSPINGLSKFNGTTWTNYQAPVASVFSLDVDNNNDLWVRDIHGFYKFSNGNKSNEYSLGSNFNTLGSLRVDALNNVWASGMTPTGAVFQKFNGTTWQDMSTAIAVNSFDMVQHYPIWDIEKDVQGNLWFGQAQSGTGKSLIKYDGINWNNYSYDYITTLGIGIDGIWLGNPDFALRLVKNCQPIISQPQDQTAPSGNNVTFTVSTSGQNDTYLWQVDKNIGMGFETLQNGTLYTGVNTGSLIVNNIQSNLTDYRFRCVIDSGSLCNQITDTVKIIIGTVGISEVRGQDIFSLYPNPTRGKLIIQSSTKIQNIELISSIGQIIHLPAGKEVDIEQLAAGLYYVRINKKNAGMIIKE